jgi:hypothetical protein
VNLRGCVYGLLVTGVYQQAINVKAMNVLEGVFEGLPNGHD